MFANAPMDRWAAIGGTGMRMRSKPSMLSVRLRSAEPGEAALRRAIYDAHAAVLWRYALRLTGDASHAEDVV